MKQLLTFLAILYSAMCLMLFVFQRKLLYYPQPPAFDLVTTNQLQPVSFESNNISLRGWLLNPGHAKALLYYGGNAEQIEQNIDFFASMNLNHSVYFVAYRGYGESEGSPSEGNLTGDALAIYDQIKSQHTDIDLIGRSLGSGIATYVAARREVSKLILVTPYDSIENVAKQAYRIFPVSLLIKDRFRSWENIESISANTLVLAAEHDRVIPPERTEALISYFDPKKLEVITIKGADHNDIGIYPEYYTSIRKILR